MDDLNAPAQTRLKQTAKRLNIPLQKLVQFKPWLAAVMIGQVARARHGINPKDSMLMHFHQEAKARHMPVVALESNAKQVH
jgi:uncharacterized protein YbaP (TraB family)